MFMHSVLKDKPYTLIGREKGFTCSVIQHSDIICPNKQHLHRDVIHN